MGRRYAAHVAVAHHRAPSRASQTDTVTRLLMQTKAVRALCLVGSTARGDARRDSDIDLVVVTDQPARQLLRALPPQARGDRVSLICQTPAQLHAMAREGSLFLHHARTEGKLLYDPDRLFETAFAEAANVPLDTVGEIRRRTAALRHYQHLERFGDRYRFVLADLYSIAKAIAVAWCAQLDEPTYVKADALRRVADAQPDLREDLSVVAALRPFYDASRGHAGELLPFDPAGAREETLRALEAVTRLAHAAP
jgi:hypothetical protein